jgi:hypothetical protein
MRSKLAAIIGQNPPATEEKPPPPEIDAASMVFLFEEDPQENVNMVSSPQSIHETLLSQFVS